MGLLDILILYIAFRIKHFTCDFLLQAPWQWMAIGKGLPGKEGRKGLMIHGAIHAAGTLIVTLIFAPLFWWLAIVDFFLHSAIDFMKARWLLAKGWNTEHPPFWVLLGFDQELHNYTHLAFIVFIVLNSGIVLS